MESRLGMLMDNFAISGKDLSSLLHIDSSLVSKWRNGKRRLKPHSVYTNQIIKHVMTLDSNNQHAKIRLLLSKDYVNIYKSTEEEVALFLKDWLTTDQGTTESQRDFFDEIREMSNTAQLTTYSLSGNAGRRQAMEFFLKYAQHISPGVEVWCYTSESTRWLAENSRFLDEWWTRFMHLLEGANRVRVIHPFNSSYESLALSVLAWMPMHMTGRTTAFFLPRYKDEQLAYTFYLIKDHLALYNWSSRQASRELNTYITHEAELIQDIETMLESQFSESARVFERYGFDARDDYMNNMISIMEREAMEYHWSISLYATYIPETMLRQVLTEHGLSRADLEEMLERVHLMAELASKSMHTHIVDLERIRETLSQEMVDVVELSFVSGRRVQIPRALHIELLRMGLKFGLESDNVRLCLASTINLRRLGNTDVLAKEGGRICFSSTRGERPMVMVTKEPTVVAALYSYFEELWNTTSHICKNKEYVTRQILKLLDEHEAAHME